MCKVLRNVVSATYAHRLPPTLGMEVLAFKKKAFGANADELWVIRRSNFLTQWRVWVKISHLKPTFAGEIYQAP